MPPPELHCASSCSRAPAPTIAGGTRQRGDKLHEQPHGQAGETEVYDVIIHHRGVGALGELRGGDGDVSVGHTGQRLRRQAAHMQHGTCTRLLIVGPI